MYVELTVEVREKQWSYDSKHKAEAQMQFEIDGEDLNKEFVESLAPMLQSMLKRAYQKYTEPKKENEDEE